MPFKRLNRNCSSSLSGSSSLTSIQLWDILRPSTPRLVCSMLPGFLLIIAEIAIGAVYLHECPREPYIPIYLIVRGVLNLTTVFISCLPCMRPQNGTVPYTQIAVCATWNVLVSLFLLCWFIVGNVWIYSIYQPNYNKDAADPDLYCNKNLYLFAFWISTLLYIFLGVAVLGACCTLFCFCLCIRADPDPDCLNLCGMLTNIFKFCPTTAAVSAVTESDATESAVVA